MAEVFVSMAYGRGYGGDGRPGSDRSRLVPTDKRDLLEQFIVNVAANNCNPMIVPALDWEYLPGEGGVCLIVDIERLSSMCIRRAMGDSSASVATAS